MDSDLDSDFSSDLDSELLSLLDSDLDSELLELLKNLEVNQVLVESGPVLATALMKHGLIDEIVAYIAPSILGGGSSFIGDLNISTLSDRLDYQIHNVAQIGNDLRVTLIGRR